MIRSDIELSTNVEEADSQVEFIMNEDGIHFTEINYSR